MSYDHIAPDDPIQNSGITGWLGFPVQVSMWRNMYV